MKKTTALMRFLETNKDEAIKLIDSGDYLVLNEEEANEKAKESIINLIDDCGVTTFNNYKEFIDDDFFYDVYREHFDIYIGDIREEGDRLDEEMKEAGVDNEEDFLNHLLEQTLVDYGSYVEAYAYEHGDSELEYIVKQYNCINIDDFVNECIEIDGRGHVISLYDGIEHEIEIDGEILYIYRNN